VAAAVTELDLDIIIIMLWVTHEAIPDWNIRPAPAAGGELRSCPRGLFVERPIDKFGMDGEENSGSNLPLAS
jgi:hypothetical protein